VSLFLLYVLKKRSCVAVSKWCISDKSIESIAKASIHHFETATENLTMLGLPAPIVSRQAGLGQGHSKKKKYTYPTICLGSNRLCFTMTLPCYTQNPRLVFLRIISFCYFLKSTHKCKTIGWFSMRVDCSMISIFKPPSEKCAYGFINTVKSRAAMQHASLYECSFFNS
jgi:hypothetical protein